MRPVDFQPAVLAAPNAERAQQQQQSQPQVSQQAFAGQMEKLAEERVHQVRETGQGHKARPAEDLTEDKKGRPRLRNRRRPSGGTQDKSAGEQKGDALSPADGVHIDVRI